MRYSWFLASFGPRVQQKILPPKTNGFFTWKRPLEKEKDLKTTNFGGSSRWFSGGVCQKKPWYSSYLLIWIHIEQGDFAVKEPKKFRMNAYFTNLGFLSEMVWTPWRIPSFQTRDVTTWPFLPLDSNRHSGVGRNGLCCQFLYPRKTRDFHKQWDLRKFMIFHQPGFSWNSSLASSPPFANPTGFWFPKHSHGSTKATEAAACNTWRPLLCVGVLWGNLVCMLWMLKTFCECQWQVKVFYPLVTGILSWGFFASPMYFF